MEERAGEGGEGARMSERYASLMETGFTRGTTDHFSTVGLAEPAPPSLQQKPLEDALSVLRDFFQRRPRHILLGCFREMDLDGSGQLDVREFARAMRAVGVDLSDADLKAVFDVFDHSAAEDGGNGNGKISLIEFIAAMAAEPAGSTASRFYRYGIGQLMLSRNMDPPDYSSAQPVAPTGFTRTPALHQSLSSIASSSDGVRTRSVLSDASTSERVLNVDSASVQAVDAAAEKAAGEWKARSRPTSARHWKARSGS